MSFILRFFKSPVFADEDETRTARFLNAILWTMGALLLGLLMERTINGGNVFDSANSILAGLILIMAMLQFVMRRGYVRAASFVMVAATWTAMAYLAWNADGLYDITYVALIVAVMIASLLLGWRVSVFFTALSLVLGWAFAFAHLNELIPIHTDQPLNLMRDFTAVFIVIGLLIYLNIDSLSRALKRTRQSNQELREMSADLEKRVVERTRDLELAVEVSRNLTRVRDLDTLLKESSELIRDRFNLYHVQIYLADSTQRILTLRAGTGRVARELLARGHNLTIASGSINGDAALNKKAVIVADTNENSMFQPNPLLPNTRSEMAVPLLLGDRVLGVLDLQSSEANSLTEEALPAFETLAGELAVAIDNANLFTEAERARQELGSYLKRLTREGWADYLDGINREENLAFVYDSTDSTAGSSRSDVPVSANGNALRLPITIANQSIGVIQVEANDDRQWTENVISLVSTVARQVAQQVENLRLLEEAQRYRDQAEAAVRRMTHEGWQSYLQDQAEVVRGYLYDQEKVRLLADDTVSSDTSVLEQTLQVRGETIGSLALYGVETSPETTELLQSVTARLSDHLENLRLSAQTEKALAETAEQSSRLAILNEIGRDLSGVASTDEIFTILSQHMKSIISHDHLTLILLKPGERCDVLAIVEGKAVILLENQPVAGTVVEQIVAQRQLAYLADVREHDYPDTNAMVEKGVRSAVIAPLITARGVLGIVDVESSKVDAFNDQDKNLLQQVASLVASTLESQQLFAEAQKQAAKERLVNLVSQKIQSTVTIESALETTITELGKALQARYTKAELSLVKESIQES